MEQHQSAIVFATSHMTVEGMVTMSILALMSISSWMVIVGKLLGLRKQAKLADKFYASFEKVSDPLELIGRDKDFEGAPP